MTVGNPAVSKGAVIGIGNTQEGSSPAITYAEIGLVTNINAFGVEYDVVSFKPLKTGAEERLLAGYGVGTITLQLGKDLSDTGQAAVKSALGVNTYYNFQITANDATATLTTPGKQTFKAKVSSYKTNYDSQNNVIGATITLEVKASSFTDVAASA